MSDQENDMMGYDPLEWLKGEGEATSTEQAEEHTEDTNASRLNLESSLQIMDVALLKPRLQESLNAKSPITLQADANIVVDGAGMQLLLAFVQQAKTNEIALQWEELPPPIAEAANLLNAEQVMLLD